ncbi:MAG: hypothetical protein AAF541_11970 [Pseudomonadota bacterium]
MKLVLKIVGVVVGLFVLLMIVQTIASESGEVVVVESLGADGQASETRLWVVDHDGAMWLRDGAGGAGWHQRMVANPQVTMSRADRSYDLTAVPVPEQTVAINQLMNEKYGWADDFIGLMFGRDNSVAIRLDPR